MDTGYKCSDMTAKPKPASA